MVLVVSSGYFHAFQVVFVPLEFWPNPMAGCWDNWGFIRHRVTEWQSDRHPSVLSIRVGEIFLCLTSINSPTRFACRGITLLILMYKSPKLELGTKYLCTSYDSILLWNSGVNYELQLKIYCTKLCKNIGIRKTISSGNHEEIDIIWQPQMKR